MCGHAKEKEIWKFNGDCVKKKSITLIVPFINIYLTKKKPIMVSTFRGLYYIGCLFKGEFIIGDVY